MSLAACARVQGTCTDGAKNGLESDVDCGGPDCGACGEARACLTHDDCTTGLCRLHVCANPQQLMPCDGGPGCGPVVKCRRDAECGLGICIDGQCGPRCAPPLIDCGGACVDPRFDPLHCNGCGNTCAPLERCEQGQCRVCPPGMLACGQGPSLRCVNQQIDVLHCGDCVTSCTSAERCIQGMCRPVCLPFQTECFGQCVNLMTDIANCGGCGMPCSAGEVCSMGMCRPSCSAPLTMCDGGVSCVDTRFDPFNCGACGAPCPPVLNARPLCIDMVCGRSLCNPGFEDCDPFPGCEANLMVDQMNCGMCGRQCSGPCQNGMCP